MVICISKMMVMMLMPMMMIETAMMMIMFGDPCSLHNRNTWRSRKSSRGGKGLKGDLMSLKG